MSINPLNLWQLEGKGAGGESWVIPINASPFRVGRKGECQLLLPGDGISRLHAELRIEGEDLWIKDNGSTNGTFVNRHQIREEQRLRPHDVIHFANLEFRVAQLEQGEEKTVMVNPYVEKFDQLLSTGSVVPHFQPLVDLGNERTVGYELLGRTDFPGLPKGVGQLFQIARQLGREVELSTLFRERGVAYAAERNIREFLFFNTLPQETELKFLQQSLGKLRHMAPHLELAMEIHENAITNIAMVRDLKAMLKELDMKLVYDDFGAGQSRLIELMDAPPDVLKFDIALVHDIHRRSDASLKLISSLVETARGIGVVNLAEGIELCEEAVVCRQIGFDLAQGFYFGRPAPGFEGTPQTGR